MASRHVTSRSGVEPCGVVNDFMSELNLMLYVKICYYGKLKSIIFMDIELRTFDSEIFMLWLLWFLT